MTISITLRYLIQNLVDDGLGVGFVVLLIGLGPFLVILFGLRKGLGSLFHFRLLMLFGFEFPLETFSLFVLLKYFGLQYLLVFYNRSQLKMA